MPALRRWLKQPKKHAELTARTLLFQPLVQMSSLQHFCRRRGPQPRLRMEGTKEYHSCYSPSLIVKGGSTPRGGDAGLLYVNQAAPSAVNMPNDCSLGVR